MSHTLSEREARALEQRIIDEEWKARARYTVVSKTVFDWLRAPKVELHVVDEWFVDDDSSLTREERLLLLCKP